MNNKITCSVINDLLPLYIDKVLSSDSTALVEEHLEKCSSCRESLERMESPITIKQISDRSRIKELKDKISLKRFVIITVLCTALIVFLIVSGVLLGNYFYCKSADSVSSIRQFWCVCVSVFLSIAILIGWGHYLLYFLERSKADNIPPIKKRVIAAYGILLIVCLLFGAGYKLMFYGSPAYSNDVSVKTEFQYSPGSYLDQNWTIHLDLMNGHAMNAVTESVYEATDFGERKWKGLKIYVRDVPIKQLLGSSGWTGGYTLADKPVIDENDDFTITVVYKDKTVVYDMRREGLFEKQDSVNYYPSYISEIIDETPDIPDITAQDE